MTKEDLAKATSKRIGHLTAVELKYSVNELENYSLFEEELLAAIHTQDFEEVGRALITALYVINQKDIEIHDVV